MLDAQILPQLVCTSFTVSIGNSLKTVAKRFSLDESPADTAASSGGEITLVLTTGLGYSTETWIPTIKRLYELQSRPNSLIRIGHVWAVESPNQGDAAVLNEHVLNQKYSEHFPLKVYGFAIHALLSSGLVDLKGSKIFGIGHSAGCAALLLAISEAERDLFASLILVEPVLLDKGVINLFEEMARRQNPQVLKRLDVWGTKEEAMNWLKARSPWKTWHPEVLQAISEFGFRVLPSVNHPNDTGVTTKTYKGQEVASNPNSEDVMMSADILERVCTSLPVHIIWGERRNFLPRRIQERAGHGRHIASISEIPGAGHLVVQEMPDKLSHTILMVLSGPELGKSTGKL